MGKFCVRCGAALSEDGFFCQSCDPRKKPPVVTVIPSAPNSQNVSAKSAVPMSQMAQTDTAVPAVPDKKKRALSILLVCGIVIVVAVAIFLLVGTMENFQAPFFGVSRGDTAEEVKKRMGKPDYFVDNGLNNFNYYYDDVEFLNMTGTVNFHFSLKMVDSLEFKCYGTFSNYKKVVKYYTDKYGEPEETFSDFADYYYESERSCWVLEDGTDIWVDYYSSSKDGLYSSPKIWIRI